MNFYNTQALLITVMMGCNYGDVVEDAVTPVDLATQENNTALQALEARVASLEDDKQNLMQQLSELEAEVVGVAKDVSDLSAGVDGLGTELDEVAAIVNDLGDDELCWISTNIIWEVGAGREYTDLPTAVEAAHNCRIWPNATLTLNLMDSEYALSQELAFTHMDGERLHLQSSDPNRPATLSFATTSGINVDNGYRLGLLKDVNIVGDPEATELFQGLQVSRGAVVHTEGTVSVTGFRGHGIRVSFGGVLQGFTFEASNNGRNGIRVWTGGIMQAYSITADSNGDHGIQSIVNGTMSIGRGGSMATNNRLEPFNIGDYSLIIE